MENIAVENLLAAFFHVESEAYQAFADLKLDAYEERSTIAQLALLKKENGQVIACETFDSGNDTSDDTVMGGFIGALVGIIGGPLGILLGGGVGALIGAAIDNRDAYEEMSMIERMSTRMQDGDTVVVALVQEEDEEIINHKLKKFDAIILRWDAADIQEEMIEAEKMEKAFTAQIKREMRKEKSEERKAKRETYRAKLKQDFESRRNSRA